MNYFFYILFVVSGCFVAFTVLSDSETQPPITVKEEFRNHGKLFTRQDVIDSLKLPMTEGEVKNPLSFELATLKSWQGAKGFAMVGDFETNETSSAVSFSLADVQLHQFHVIIAKEKSCRVVGEKILDDLLGSYSLWSLIPGEYAAEEQSGLYTLESLKTPWKMVLDCNRAFSVTVTSYPHEQLPGIKAYNLVESRKSINTILEEIRLLLTRDNAFLPDDTPELKSIRDAFQLRKKKQ
ncbi:MAG: hypothetical protein LBM70_03830 [Victivallales bacterium]|jgi:hypothetical protein|nr:hypothetical protein [Victivallales bacterium]